LYGFAPCPVQFLARSRHDGRRDFQVLDALGAPSPILRQK